MMSLTQQLARSYLSKQRKTGPRVKLCLPSIMIYQLRSYSLTSKNILSHLPVIIKIYSMSTEKKQPHIDGKELKRKNKRNASRSFELTEFKWYFGVMIFFCLLLFPSFAKIQISRMCCSLEAVTKTEECFCCTKLIGARGSWKELQVIENYHLSAWVSVLLSRRVGLRNSRHRIKKPKERAIHTSMYKQGLGKCCVINTP